MIIIGVFLIGIGIIGLVESLWNYTDVVYTLVICCGLIMVLNAVGFLLN